MTEIIEVRRRDETRDVTDNVKNMKTDLSRQQKFKLFNFCTQICRIIATIT